MSTLTYRELQVRAHAFAGYLQAQQLEKGNCILIWSPSRSDWLVVYLGSLLVGIIVVPLDVRGKEDFLPGVVNCDDLAEVVFSLGTTGHQKGVMLSQRNKLHA